MLTDCLKLAKTIGDWCEKNLLLPAMCSVKIRANRPMPSELPCASKFMQVPELIC